jgi:hypothetical protein
LIAVEHSGNGGEKELPFILSSPNYKNEDHDFKGKRANAGWMRGASARLKFLAGLVEK